MKLISPLVLLATLAIFLSACGSAAFESGTCPTWPVAGPAVAEEMEAGAIMPPEPETDFRLFWEWVERVDKLRDQLLACQ